MESIKSFIQVYASGFAIIILGVFSCKNDNAPPLAKISAFPLVGDTSILFEFSASESEDNQSFSIALQFRWDFDGDGIWDTNYAKESAITYRYTQPGRYTVTVEVKDLDGLSAIAEDTVEVSGRNQSFNTLVDSRDGNKYRIVKIGEKWWMAENLRYGSVIPTNREQTDNDSVEMYKLRSSEPWDTAWGIYLWLETKNYRINDLKGICPGGWHLPSREEWEELFDSYPPLYSLRYYGQNGFSSLNLDLSNGGVRVNGIFYERSVGTTWDTGFWSSSYKEVDQNYLPYFCSFSSDNQSLAPGYWHESGLVRYYSVRCVNDS